MHSPCFSFAIYSTCPIHLPPLNAATRMMDKLDDDRTFGTLDTLTTLTKETSIIRRTRMSMRMIMMRRWGIGTCKVCGTDDLDVLLLPVGVQEITTIMMKEITIGWDR